MSHRLISAKQFRPILSLVAGKSRCNLLGLTFIPQEGSGAGQLDSVFISTSNSFSRKVQEINVHCEHLLFHRQTKIYKEVHVFEHIEFVALRGQFCTNVGYVWYENSKPIESGLVDFLVDHILTLIETSKKARFHDIFTKNIAKADLSTIFLSIADTIKSGLYCDEIVVWKRERGLLKSVNVDGLDLAVSGSLAGETVKTGERVYHDISTIPVRKIGNVEYFRDNNINSAFMFRIGGNEVDDRELCGVVGVFYHRPYGTTEIDRQLCRFAIDYYEVVWRQNVIIENLKLANTEFEEIKPFYRDAIKSLVDFHDLTALHLGVSQAASSARILAHNKPELEDELKIIEKGLNDLRILINRNENALTVAPKFVELMLSGSDTHTQLTDLNDLLDYEIDKISNEATRKRARISRHFKLEFSRARVVKEDYQRVLTNLLTNAVRAVGRRQQGGGLIKVTLDQSVKSKSMITISVEDNGPGIEEDDLSKIFDVHYTTHGQDGGKGMGLAIVKAVSNKYDSVPEVRSIWGEGARFRVKLGFK